MAIALPLNVWGVRHIIPLNVEVTLFHMGKSKFKLNAVFRNTMFGPEGRPQHCCAWLGVASSFPECASPIVPEEVIHQLAISVGERGYN
ncbi:hypothetical protein POTOM_061221 [Populus tomentosa]|uniref:Uncharacterized protein n=1 Tax=Populus tomentosa TaxID=118781 RepID=A0A8X7XSV8_POPTO|nr:hypothetical protein POTOM_061221 [Populus tomentosa]